MLECKRHPNYQGKHRPRVECKDCLALYYHMQEIKKHGAGQLDPGEMYLPTGGELKWNGKEYVKSVKP